MTDSTKYVEPTIQERIAEFDEQGASLLVQAGARIFGRMWSWTLVGFFLAVVTTFIQIRLDVITIEIGDWSPIVFHAMIGMGYALVSMCVFAYIGVFRGVGRTMQFIGVEHGLAYYLLEHITQHMDESLRYDAQGNEVEQHTQLTEDVWMRALPGVVNRYVINEARDDLGKLKGFKGEMAKLLRRLLCQQIAVLLLDVAHKQGDDATIESVKDEAFERAPTFLKAYTERVINKQLKIGLLVCLSIYVLVPSLIAISRLT